MIEVELKEWGNSIGAIIPMENLKELGLEMGDKIVIDIIQKKTIDGFGICNRAKPFKEEKESHNKFWL